MEKKEQRKALIVLAFLFTAIIFVVMISTSDAKYTESTEDMILRLANEACAQTSMNDFTLVSVVEGENYYKIVLESKKFDSFEDSYKMETMRKLNKNKEFYFKEKDFVTIVSNGNEYTAKINDYLDKHYRYLYKNGEKVYEDVKEPEPYVNKVEENNSSSSHNSGNGGGGSSHYYKKCSHCNGTGYVKYYSTETDLEAWLNGYDSYYTGPCTSCNGTGRG